MSTLPHPPYPSDTLARGWRFELDHEAIERSDTWALAPAEARPWLLMLWMTAWRESPCGSLPDSDELIAAKVGMPLRLFAKHRTVLRRGWSAASDGRLYHATITSRVLTMLDKREGDKRRTAKNRALKAATASPAAGNPDPNNVTPVSRVTPPSLMRESDVSSLPEPVPGEIHSRERKSRARACDAEPPEACGQPPTLAGQVCRAMQQAGFRQTNPGDPRLAELLRQGATEAEFVDLAREAITKRKGWPWLLVALQNRRAEAAAIRLAPAEDAKPWDTTRSGIEAMGERLNVGRWDEEAFHNGRGEPFSTYHARVRHAVETQGTHA